MISSPKQQITEALKNGRIEGSWIISGPYGVGKKTFVKQLCSFLIMGDWNTHLNYDPNIKWIEYGLTDEAKKEIQKMILAGKQVEENDKTTAHKKEITVDEIRDAIKFLSLKPGKNEYRIVIISPADDMNRHASNALLKILEEPYPRSIIILLSQNSGKLLPTIRSRCRQIIIPRLSFSEEVAILKKKFQNCQECELIAELSDGSIGLGIKIYETNGLSIYQKMNSFFVPIHNLDIEKVNDFAETVYKNDDAFFLFQTFLLHWFNKQIKETFESQSILSESLLTLYKETNILFKDVANLYLDKKQAIINSLLKISEVLS